MDYRKIYYNLVKTQGFDTRAGCRDVHGYAECHHIVPRCLGGSDEPSNLIFLSGKAHFLAHRLLAKIHPDSRALQYAVFAMSKTNGMKVTSVTAGLLSKKASQKGTKRKPLSADTKLKMSKSLRGQKKSPETRAKMSAARKKLVGVRKVGWKLSPETRARMSEARMRMSAERRTVANGNT